MRRLITWLIAIALAAGMPVSVGAREDVKPIATPQATPGATPVASPVSTGLAEGNRNYQDENDNYLNIQLTALAVDTDGASIVEEFDPETEVTDVPITLVGEIDAPDGCRAFEYELLDDALFIALCADAEFGLWVVASREDAVLDVAESFVNGESDIVPAGYRLIDEVD